MSEKKDVIILSRMYAGEYLKERIGHEVINLFQTDDGINYIYVNEDGRINEKYNDRVKAVLLVRYVEKGVMEVIAKAEDLEQILYKGDGDIQKQIEYCDNNHVTYCGVEPYKVHKHGSEYGVITFKVNNGNVRRPQKSLYLIEDNEKISSYDNVVFLPKRHFSSTSLKMYYEKNSDLKDDYIKLDEMIGDASKWEKTNTTEKVDIHEYDGSLHDTNFLNIIRKENDELVYSNMLAYFFEQNRKVFAEFAKEVLHVESFSTQFDVEREKDHIDLQLEDDKHLLIIENKIKSKINGERHDPSSDKFNSQLHDYYKLSKKYTDDNGKELRCYVFAPDYNYINLEKYIDGDKYVIIKYSEIFNFYDKHAGKMIRIKYFDDFLAALEMQKNTIDNSNYETMKERFITQIRKIRGE